MCKKRREVVTHIFKGPRFEDHGLDIDVLPDLLAYKTLLVETAKELWRREHPDRQRLLKGFEKSLVLKFYKLEKGSTCVPLEREVEAQGTFLPDELDDAVTLIADTTEAAESNSPLPENLPKSVIPLFANYGKTLRDDEFFEQVIPNRDKPARYTPKARDEVLRRVQDVYEDIVELTGEVRAADLDGCNFTLRLDDGKKVSGKFTSEQEAILVEALHNHATCRLEIRGRGEFDPGQRDLKRILEVEQIRIKELKEPEYDSSVKPIWETIVELGKEVPADEWDKVPTDLAKNLDKYLYGNKQEDK